MTLLTAAFYLWIVLVAQIVVAWNHTGSALGHRVWVMVSWRWDCPCHICRPEKDTTP